MKTIDKRNDSYRFLFLFLLFIFIFAIQVDAQESKDTTIWQIETKEGEIFRGVILSQSRKKLALKTESQEEIELKKKDIYFKEVYDPKRLIDGELWSENRLNNRNLLVPTGMLQTKGKGYYENKYLAVNHLNLAFTDGFSLGLGIIPAFIVNSYNPETPVWIVPKFRIPVKNKNFHLSTGIFISTTIFRDDYYPDDDGAKIAYIMGTYGNKNMSLSLGLGYGTFGFDGWLNTPAFSFSNTIRVGKRSYLFIESIFMNSFNRKYDYELQMLYLVGGRSLWKKISLDFGVLGPGALEDYSDSGFIVWPYAGLVFPFGK